MAPYDHSEQFLHIKPLFKIAFGEFIYFADINMLLLDLSSLWNSPEKEVWTCGILNNPCDYVLILSISLTKDSNKWTRGFFAVNLWKLNE